MGQGVVVPYFEELIANLPLPSARKASKNPGLALAELEHAQRAAMLGGAP
jgi:hypothetical protein